MAEGALRSERFRDIERKLQAYGDGPPYYRDEEDAAFGRCVADVAWLHDELIKAVQGQEPTVTEGSSNDE